MSALGARPSGRFTVRTRAGIGIIRARPAWRMLKRAEARAPIPTGLRPKAQGCRVREATLGSCPEKSSTLKGLHPSLHSGLMQPRWGWENILGIFPRVARPSQPWAGRRYPVGVIPTGLRHACPSAWVWRMLTPASRP